MALSEFLLSCLGASPQSECPEFECILLQSVTDICSHPLIQISRLLSQ